MADFNSRALTSAPSRVTMATEDHVSRSFVFAGNRYQMEGTISGAAVQWVTTGQPDTTGAQYTGGGTPANIVARGPF